MFEPYARDALRLAAVPPGARILDVACGPGTLSMVAAQAGHPVDGIDFSPAMIERFEARRSALGVTRATARIGDGQALPFDDATFGAAFSMFGLMFFPDRAQGLRELRRVLVPGARGVIASWHRFEDSPVLAAMFGALRETMSKLLGPTAPMPGSKEMPLVTEDACRAEMSAAFSDVEVHRMVHARTYASAEAVWPSIERTMAPIAVIRKQLGEERWAPLSAAAGSAIRAAIGDDPPVVTLPAWLSVGVAS